ncbi:MAG TPA: alpha/beta hydrolase [Candidatus Anaerofilum excrementigallinarum]|nr:alpha/beta hydrolase [Candidatus Anaerofilum excrementigallinarum]
MNTFAAGGKTISVFPSTEPGAPAIYLNTFAEEGQKVFRAAQASGCPPFTLVAISDLDWNHDMVPWDSPPAFKNAQPCTGGADDYLRLMTEQIIPMAEKQIPAAPQWRGIAGYSLAGLFALYAAYRTDAFSRVGSMSGSLWFPGIKEYVASHEPKRQPDCIYFSLGDKESKTRNPMLKNVRQNTEEICSFYKAKGITAVFQLNPGNHYDHAAERTAAGICWLLREQ